MQASNKFSSDDKEAGRLYLDTASAVVTKPVTGSVLSSQALAPEEGERENLTSCAAAISSYMNVT